MEMIYVVGTVEIERRTEMGELNKKSFTSMKAVPFYKISLISATSHRVNITRAERNRDHYFFGNYSGKTHC